MFTNFIRETIKQLWERDSIAKCVLHYPFMVLNSHSSTMGWLFITHYLLFVIYQVVSHSCLTVEAWLRSQVSQCEISGGQSCIGMGFSWVLKFCPVSIISPMLPALSSIYHSCYIMLGAKSTSSTLVML